MLSVSARYGRHVARGLAAAALTLSLLIFVGCSQKRVDLVEVLPKGLRATPWVLSGEIWSGTPEQALAGLGREVEVWDAFDPQQVWLAVYQHETHSDHELITRIWSFPSAAQARRAYQHFRPTDATSFEVRRGGEGCWTPDGLLVVWGRLVIDIFGRGPGDRASPEQAMYLLAFIEKDMPADLPDQPR